MQLDGLNPWQWAVLLALTIAGVASVALLSAWVARAARPRWFWRVAALLALLYPVLRAPALSLWVALVVQAATIIFALLVLHAGQRVGVRVIARFRFGKRDGNRDGGSAVARVNALKAGRWQFTLSDVLGLTCIVAVLAAGMARQFDRPLPEWAQPLGFGAILAALSLLGLWIGTWPTRWYGWVARVAALSIVAGALAGRITEKVMPFDPQYYVAQFVFAMALPLTVAVWAALLRRTFSALYFANWLERTCRAGALVTSLAIAGLLLVGYLALNNDPGMPQEPIPQPNGYDELAKVADRFVAPASVNMTDPWQQTELQISQLLRETAQSREWAKSVARLPSAAPLANSYDEQEAYWEPHINAALHLANAWHAEAILAARRGDRSESVQALWNILELCCVQRQGGLVHEHIRALYSEYRALEAFRDLPGWPHDPEYHALVPRLLELETRLEPFTACEIRNSRWERHIDWTCRIEYLLNDSIPTHETTRTGVMSYSGHMRLTVTELALSKYQAEHGTYPERLEQLVPEILTAVPEDPFGDEPLKYRRAGAGYVLYSVGADGRDNGGLFDPGLGSTPDRDAMLRLPRHPRLPPAPR